MIGADWALMGYAVYVPLLIIIYLLVLLVIFKRRKDSFDSTFYIIFGIMGAVNVAACLICCFVFRLPKYSLVNGFYSSMTTNSWWLNAAHSGAYYLISLSELLGVLLASNRFSALFCPLGHEQFWRRFLFVGVMLGSLLSVAPVYLILGSPTKFFKVNIDISGANAANISWSKGNDDNSTFTFYYYIHSETQRSIGFNMACLTVACNAASSVLYLACIIRLRCFSVTQHPPIQRKLFLVGFLTLIFSLPYTASMVIFYVTFYGAGDAKRNLDIVRFWGFQHPWLLDLMQLTPAPMLLATSGTMRRAVKAIFINN